MSIRKFAPAGLRITPASEADRRYMDLACHIGLWSKHLANKLGAVIVDDAGWVISLGFNGHRAEIEDGDPLNWTKPERFIHSVHAEENALINARLNGLSVEGATMHVLRFPCSGNDALCIREGCSHKIVAAGIRTVVVYSPPSDADHPMTPNFRRSLELLASQGIAIRWHDPDDATYYPRMVPRPDTAPVPSRSVNWPSRFLDLAQYLGNWQPGGCGEVIVHRAEAGNPALDRMEKIVRCLGCWSEASPAGALEAGAALGLSLEECTIYFSTIPNAQRLVAVQAKGLQQVIVPQRFRNSANFDACAESARDLKLELVTMKPDLQPAAERELTRHDV